jgi:hypothetical protein
MKAITLSGFLTLVFLCGPARGETPPYELDAPIARIAPTQMEIGKAHVGFSIEKVHKRALARELKSGEKSDTNLLEAILSRPLPGVIDPDGRIRIRDGHHWASAVTEIAKQRPDLAGRINVRVQVEADFSGKSWAECARYMHRNNIGYFTKETREKYGPLETLPDDKLVELYTRYLPKELGDLKNSPGRSAAGMALERMGIEPELGLEDYIEFFLAEDFEADLRRTDVDLSRFERFETVDERIIGRVEALMATKPKVILYLLSRTRPDVDHAKAQAMILEKINLYRTRELGIPAFHPETLPSRRIECVATAAKLAL